MGGGVKKAATPWPSGGKPSIAGSYGLSDPSGMTRLFVNGTKPPAPSGTTPGTAQQKNKKQIVGFIYSSKYYEKPLPASRQGPCDYAASPP
jgi:hypothetical protein